MKRVLVWDIPTRVAHWLLVIIFILSFVTGDSEERRLFHVATGYAMGGVLVFRVFWGIAGTRYARFASFLFSPREVAVYLGGLLKGKTDNWLGHNPAGSYAIFTLMLLGFATVVTGYADYEEMGGELMEEIHGALAYTVLGIAVLHVLGAIVSSWIYRENLVRSMFSGYKDGESRDAIESGKIAWAIVPVILAILAGLLVFIT